MSPLVLAETLGVFVNTFTADEKYPVQECENLQLPIQLQLSQNEKLCLNFLFHFWNVHQTLNVLKKNMIVIANVFPKLQSVKIVDRKLYKEYRFRTGFGCQHVKVSEILAKSQ